jgi:8-oxo-dGTP pyrophosphatase MutT (NUDIX family)
VSDIAERTVERVRSRLLDPESALTLDVRGATDAAVLVPLFFVDDVMHVVFTRRHHDLPRHPGEISFPGGRREEQDADLRATALREAEEEVGLTPAAVRLLGALQPTPTIVSGYAIHPYVGLIEPGFPWVPSAREVDEVIEVSVPALIAGYARRPVERRGVTLRTDSYLAGEHLIWGATARILSDLLDRVADADPD